MRSIGLLTFMLPVGYSAASGILTGNAIGESKPKLAMTYYFVCMFMASFITVLQMSVLWFGTESFVNMYTNNPKIAYYLRDAWPILILFTLFDTTQAMGMSVIRATGKQAVGAVITGTAYFALGVPISWYFAFKKGMDVRGLWWGPTLATAYNTLWYNFIIFTIDWPRLIQETKDRVAAEKKLREELQLEEQNKDKFAKVDTEGNE